MKKTTFCILASLLLVTGFSQQAPRRFLVRDEGISQLAYIDEANSANNWYVPIPTGRDMQLSGNGRVLVGTGNGYEEHDVVTGKKVSELNSFPGTVCARKLKNGNVLLTGVNWQQQQGIVLVEIKDGAVLRTIAFPGFNYVRLVRETNAGTFLVTADDVVFEGDVNGKIIWQAKVIYKDKPHAWQALRLANGQTVVSSGYAANLQFFGKDGALVKSITAPENARPHFFSGFQVLANGNFLVSNWQGHGPRFGASGLQVVELAPDGTIAWSWQQDAAKFSSLQSVILLDGLDTKYLHAEDGNGRLSPIK